MLVFVYGTLLRGMCRFPALSHAEPMGPALAQGKLYDLGDYPGLRPGSDVVVGEIYRVDARTLDRLDGIEDYYPDCPESSLYLRRPIQVRLLADGRRLQAETYLYASPLPESRRIADGDYRRHVLEKQGGPQWMAAYGSNSSRQRLEARVGPVGERIVGCLPDFEMRLNTADPARAQVFANIRFSPGARCPAMLQRLNAQQMDTLDHYEGTPEHYLRVALPFLPDGEIQLQLVQLWIAHPDTLAEGIAASEAYLAHIRQGYREMGLDAAIAIRPD
ncbi:MAG: gamma-glutamylcyclotransferase [Gammaproteobacteria bacterium]|nr:gamma-glutamylcyclotransferase [Gammaproteobacteria bacterium]